MAPPDHVLPPSWEDHTAHVVKPLGPRLTLPTLELVSGCHWFEPTIRSRGLRGLTATVSSPSANGRVFETLMTGDRPAASGFASARPAAGDEAQEEADWGPNASSVPMATSAT